MKDLKVIVFLFMIALKPLSALAQINNFDYLSVEALIADHKSSRSLMQARAVLEEGNLALHSLVEKSSTSYHDINVNLDKYTRSFEIIDLLYTSLKTALNATSTVNDVSEKLSLYRDLLSSFNEKIIKRGKVEEKDTLILTISYKCIDNIYQESKSLYSSFSDLVLYVTGVSACSTSNLMQILEEINSSLDKIKFSVDSAYLSSWRYIKCRTGYWKESAYSTITKEQILDDALSRWKTSAVQAIK